MKSARRALAHVPPALIERVQRSAGKRSRGMVAAIDRVTGQFFLGRTVLEAGTLGRARLGDPRRQFHFIRIGFDAVHSHTGGWKRA